MARPQCLRLSLGPISEKRDLSPEATGPHSPVGSGECRHRVHFMHVNAHACVRAPTNVFCGDGPAPSIRRQVGRVPHLRAHAHTPRLAHAHDPPPRPTARLTSTLAAESLDGNTSGNEPEASVEKVRFNAETELPSPASFCRGLAIIGCTLLMKHVLDLSHVASGVLIVSAACLIENMDRVRVHARESLSLSQKVKCPPSKSQRHLPGPKTINPKPETRNPKPGTLPEP